MKRFMVYDDGLKGKGVTEKKSWTTCGRCRNILWTIANSARVIAPDGKGSTTNLIQTVPSSQGSCRNHAMRMFGTWKWQFGIGSGVGQLHGLHNFLGTHVPPHVVVNVRCLLNETTSKVPMSVSWASFELLNIYDILHNMVAEKHMGYIWGIALAVQILGGIPHTRGNRKCCSVTSQVRPGLVIRKNLVIFQSQLDPKLLRNRNVFLRDNILGQNIP